MIWTEKRIAKLEVKDKEAADFIRGIIRSPYYESYISCLTQLQNWNIELQNSPTEIGGEGESNFQRAHKFISTQSEILDSLDAIRTRMLPDEIAKAGEVGIDILDQARLNMKNKKIEKV